ncbi:MAG: ribosome silencing factor [Pseudarcicella sp.]|nr:ribosome silencing factor [Pseudarcicella sp.]MBP6410461.1 ribosome silencing factor [Pseudarcicella sp.]
MAKKQVATENISSENLANLVIKGMQEMKGQDIVLLDMRNVKNAFTDFFVICSGTSDTQIDAISESVDKEVWQKTQTHPRSFEGKENKEWILVDYYDVVVHVFKKDKRSFYRLEDLWGDAEITRFED